MAEKVQTLHPDPKKRGLLIDRSKYELVRAALLDTLAESSPIGFQQLLQAVEEKVSGKLEGSPAWYFETVKLDLEARGIIEHDRRARPSRVYLKQAATD